LREMITNGVISMIVTLPLTAFLVFVFARMYSKNAQMSFEVRRAELEQKTQLLEQDSAERKEYEALLKRDNKYKCMISYKVIQALGWGASWAILLFCAYIVLLYGLDFDDKATSGAWLGSCAFSILLDLLFLQPLKVLCLQCLTCCGCDVDCC